MLKIRKRDGGVMVMADIYDVNGNLLSSTFHEDEIKALDFFSAMSAALIAGFRAPIVRE